MRAIVDSTEDFEVWMRKRTDVSNRLLEKKHRKMADGAFASARDRKGIDAALTLSASEMDVFGRGCSHMHVGTNPLPRHFDRS